jgi:hypothetical protein
VTGVEPDRPEPDPSGPFSSLDSSDPGVRARFEATGVVAFLLGVASVVLGVPTSAGAAMFVPFVVLVGGLVLTRVRWSRSGGRVGGRSAVTVERWRRYLVVLEVPVLVPLLALEPWAGRPNGRALLALGSAVAAGIVAAWQFGLDLPGGDPAADDVPSSGSLG